MQWFSEEQQSGSEGSVPKWFDKYTSGLLKRKVDLLREVDELSKLNPGKLRGHLGGNIEELPYEVLETLFIGGSDNGDVAALLRKKREEYVRLHPEKSRGAQGADQGIITFNGRFIPQLMWSSASDSEKRGALVGSTCFHYNSDTPGMGSNPNDRF